MRPYLRAANVTWGGVDVADVLEMNFTPQEFESYRLQRDDILLSEASGSPSEVGKPAIWNDELPACCFQNTLIRVRSRGPLPKYLYFQFLYFALSVHFGQTAKGVGIRHLGAERLAEFEVLIAPLAEQRRIVEAIETELTRLDAGVASLRAARAKLRRYRASVLKAACEGRLVEQDPSDEPASALLQRILAERRERWAADLRAKGKDPAKARYEEPAAPDVAGLPGLPAGWAIASMDALTVRITSGSRDWSQYYGEGSGTFLMAQNVRPGFLDLSYRQPVDPPPNDRDRVRSQVERDDLLVTIVGANTGDVCRVPDELSEHYVCQSVALMRPVNRIMSKYLELYLISPENGRHQYEQYMYGQGRPHLSFEQLKVTAIALPPLAEQHRIVAEVERRLSVVAAMEGAVAANLKRAERLRQAILKRAFEGKLVPQDPSDEPASVLLERIRRQGDKGPRGQGAKGAGRRGGPRKEAAQPTGRALPASEPVQGADQLKMELPT
jgi:type I restriction enzyme S subunit